MSTNRHHEFMRRAIQLSIENVESHAGGPFGAVVVRDGVIVGEGSNKVTSSNDPTAHAEIEAIRAACRKLGTFELTGATIYTSCEPCPMCLSAIYWARIGEIYYANTKQDASAIKFDDAFIYEEIAKAIDRRTVPMSQLMRDEALEAFAKWNADSTRVNY